MQQRSPKFAFVIPEKYLYCFLSTYGKQMHTVNFAGIWSSEITGFMEEKSFFHYIDYGWPVTICSSLYFIWSQQQISYTEKLLLV